MQVSALAISFSTLSLEVRSRRVCHSRATCAPIRSRLRSRSRLDAQRIALGDERGDGMLGIENALALNFGRMRGEHRGDPGVIEHPANGRVRHAGLLQPLETALEATGLRPFAGRLTASRRRM